MMFRVGKFHEILLFSARRGGHRAFGMSVRAYDRTSVDQVKILSKVESQELFMVASWYIIWGCIFVSPAGIYKSHDLMTYISRSTDLGFWQDYQG